ncbi:hypothetical protein HF1_12740 [Mycoplasma haemofelis str. Langford 1]|uniref:Uncharacterized protein n=1 Tax=Mycoplasma haemofelis (strain Langford 1) TaxID=941640 RepID=E8ZJG1_MYCHL|nr:hypothetical protein HF1_12740 [Mycoplasma haemofelis str. Langford 1]
MVLESLKFGYLLSAAGNFYGDAHNVLFSGKNVKHKTIRSPRFLSKHYFSGFEFSSSDSFTTTFKNGVTGINPKIRGKYYVKWSEVMGITLTDKIMLENLMLRMINQLLRLF